MMNTVFALAASLLLVLAFPPVDAWPLAWVGLAPLLTALRRVGPAAAGLLAWLAGVAFFMGLFAWIFVVPRFTLTDFLILGLFLGVPWGLFGLGLRFVSGRLGLPPVLTAPVLWVSLEYGKSLLGFLSLPWGLVGQSQYTPLPVIQIAQITGVYGISFLVVVVNAALSEAALAAWPRSEVLRLRPRPQPGPAGLAAVLALTVTLTYGWLALLEPVPQETLRVSVVQGNIPQAQKWEPAERERILTVYRRLTQQAAQEGAPRLIIWPETATPGPLVQDADIMDAVAGVVRETATPLVLGSAQRPKSGPPDWAARHRHNSVYLLVPPGRVAGVYHKLHLLPFAEYLPHRDVWPWPARLAAAAGNFVPGEKAALLALGDVRFGALICWESIFPELCRRFAVQEPAFLVNVTNEAWFGDTTASRQFLMMNVFRAVEHRLALARAANTGISCFIDPCGRIMGRVTQEGRDLMVAGVLTRDVPLSQGTTFYTRHGDLFAQFNLAGAALLVAASLLRRRKELA